MKENQKKKQYQPSMSIGEQVALILYLVFGFFLLFASDHNLGCWPDRSRDVPMCSEYCWLGMDMSPLMIRYEQDGRMKQEADPLMPCKAICL